MGKHSPKIQLQQFFHHYVCTPELYLVCKEDIKTGALTVLFCPCDILETGPFFPETAFKMCLAFCQTLYLDYIASRYNRQYENIVIYYPIRNTKIKFDIVTGSIIQRGRREKFTFPKQLIPVKDTPGSVPPFSPGLPKQSLEGQGSSGLSSLIPEQTKKNNPG